MLIKIIFNKPEDFPTDQTYEGEICNIRQVFAIKSSYEIHVNNCFNS